MDKLDQIIELLIKTNERMDRIEAELACIKLDTVKMNVHINFIEKAYSIVRAPLNYIFNSTELPAITNITIKNS